MAFKSLNEFYKEQKEKVRIKGDFEVRDLRNGEWFWVHKKILELYAPKIGSVGIAAYNALCYFANNKSQKAFPSQENLALKAGCSRISVIRAIKRLKENKLIKIEYNKGKVNIYKLLKI